MCPYRVDAMRSGCLNPLANRPGLWAGGKYGMTDVRVLSFILMACVMAGCFVPNETRAEAEYVKSDGVLPIAEFYRSVACGGADPAACGAEIVRWPAAARDGLTVGIAQIDAAVPPMIRSRVIKTLGAAIAEINQSAAQVTLAQVNGRAARRAHIQIFLVAPDRRGRITTARSALLRGQILSSALVRMRHRGPDIQSAHVAIAADIDPDAIASVMLEELVQSLGLMTDILNPHYRHQSVFAEDCDCTDRLAGQDLAALRMHYPKDISRR